MKSLKRFLSLMLAMLMMLSYAPTIVYASDSVEGTTSEGDPVAKIGNNYYDTLQAAFNAVADGETITVLSNVTITEDTAAVNGSWIDGVSYSGDKSFTVDFGGYTVIDNGCVNDYLIYLNNKGEKTNEITFKNGTLVAKNGCWATLCVNGSSSTFATVLNLDSMNITNSNDTDYTGNEAVRARNLATVNVNSGTTITSDGASYGIAAHTGGTVNINSGATVIQKNSGTSGGNSVFTAVGGNGTVNIYDGAIIISNKYGVHTMTTGTPVVNVYGGTITAPVALKASTNGGADQLATINVSGGTINGTLENYTDNGKIVVTGGTFSNDVSAYLADGYEVVYDETTGTYGVDTIKVAEVNGVQYASLQAAIDAAKDDDIVTLIDDIVFDDVNDIEARKAVSNGNGKYCGFDYGNGAFVSVIGGNVTVDLNGHSITYDIHDEAWCNKRVVSIFYVTDKAKLTIVDNSTDKTGAVTVNGMGTAVYSVAVDTVVTIKGGTWTWNLCATEGCGATNIFLYASHGGELYVTGGKFVNNVEGDAGGYMFFSHYSSTETTENSAGVDYDSTRVEISGGTFVNYNPNEIKYMDQGSGNAETVASGLASGYTITENSDGSYGIEKKVDLPEVVITDITDSYDGDSPLTFALNFAIKDINNLTDEYLEKLFEQYGYYYTDYVLTISGLSEESVTFNADGKANGYLGGQYDAWSKSWVYVPFENVTINNGESLYIMEYAAKLMGQSGLRYTLAEVAAIVQDFDCGVYFTPEFLKANPDMVVTLQLKVFTEDAEGNKIENIDVATNTFTALDAIAVASVTDSEGKVTKYATLQSAIEAATDGQTVTLLCDITLAENETLLVTGAKAITIDFNDYTIYASFTNETSIFLTVKGSAELTLTDSSTDKTGGIKAIGMVDSATETSLDYMLGLAAGSKLTIKGGNYWQDAAYSAMIYANKNASGDLVVKGGTFYLGNVGTGENGSPWIFNVGGQNEGHIKVTGGTYNADIFDQYWRHEVQCGGEYAAVSNGDGTWTVKKAVAYITVEEAGYGYLVGYATVADALNAAATIDGGATVTMLADSNEATAMMMIVEGVTLDLNGYTLSAYYIASFNGAHIVDNSEENTGRLVVSAKRFMISEENAQLPVNTADGYAFVEIEKFNYAENVNGYTVAFQPVFKSKAVEILRGANGYTGESTGVEIIIRATWNRADGTTGVQDFVYNDTICDKVLGSYDANSGKFTRMFTLVINNAPTDIKYEVVIASNTGVELSYENNSNS